MTDEQIEETTIENELAPVLGALMNIDSAREKLKDLYKSRAKKAKSEAGIFMAHAEDVPAFITLAYSIVTLENVKVGIENAFTNDLRAVHYFRPVGDKYECR